MENLIRDIKENLSSYSFKDITALLRDLKVNNTNIYYIDKLSLLLNKDKRKNVSSLGDKLEKKVQKYISEVDRVKAMYNFDRSFGDYNIVAGVDEVGRGPLAGPIVACAVVLDLYDLENIILEINDSKVLSEKKREELSSIIKTKALSYSISELSNKDIDSKGIAYCNNQVFIDACNGLKVNPELVLSDGYLIKNFNIDNKFVVKGDKKSASIACASIVAKVYRDNLMKKYNIEYPNYDFDKNVGYGTKTHIDALKSKGITSIHRKTFLSNILDL